ncbi:HTH-type transcriptional regulator YjdC [Sodalis glossinidius str. 'morsitans']|uniref:Transcriptional regulator n=1 Tax=Sodalis glossinidius (strain morsitans) TaxID=343509 RepID=Q2NWA0_SODGM|nr:transcriptional regulator [Sodalis glossinidius]BAE73575.1 putative transcriptional regulator [Sodalis glossinidius str. 'morsitans']CRL43957.1 HTH-type transcriptional regulator YjdC [Sodalis glossinidius str. 'morsitans']
MQREHIRDRALSLLEQCGFARVSLPMLADELTLPLTELSVYWPDREALHHDCLTYHAGQVDDWRSRVLQDEEMDAQQKLLARYRILAEQVEQQRYPGCLFIAACSFYPETMHPIHQLAERQKHASYRYTRALLVELEADDPTMVAQQMELVLEGCLSKLLVKHNAQDVAVARRLEEDILRLALCRKNGTLS